MNLNEKLYLLIFAKTIHPKCLQNSRMVLSNLCNDYEICEKKLCYFGVNISQRNIVSSNFCRRQSPLQLLPSFLASHQLFLVLLINHLVFCEDQKQTLEVSWDRISSVIWHYYVLNMLNSTKQISSLSLSQSLALATNKKPYL